MVINILDLFVQNEATNAEKGGSFYEDKPASCLSRGGGNTPKVCGGFM